MSDGTLTIGTRRYSSWSLRGWLPVRLAKLDVEDMVIPLTGHGTPAIKAVAPGGTVPFLRHRGALVWETIAIAEYCAECAPELWPAERVARAQARSIVAEMHAGFAPLRQAMPMNLGRLRAGAGWSASVLADVARIEAIWRQTRAEFGAGGPFLFGAVFTNADAFYAPVVARFLSYGPTMGADTAAYCAAVRAHPLVDEWYRLAATEPAAWLIPATEALA